MACVNERRCLCNSKGPVVVIRVWGILDVSDFCQDIDGDYRFSMNNVLIFAFLVSMAFIWAGSVLSERTCTSSFHAVATAWVSDSGGQVMPVWCLAVQFDRLK